MPFLYFFNLSALRGPCKMSLKETHSQPGPSEPCQPRDDQSVRSSLSWNHGKNNISSKDFQKQSDASRQNSFGTTAPTEEQPGRPGPPKRQDTNHSRYVQMLLRQDTIPRLHNILAAFFVWLILAGFLVFPGTFKTLDAASSDNDTEGNAAKVILDGVKNLPLLVIGAIACGVSLAGMGILALRHVRNYVWLLNKLFMPGIANGTAGLISTLIGVYSSHNGIWSITAKVTAIIEGCYLGVCIALFVIIDQVFLSKVRQSHNTHYQPRPEDEGMVEMMERKIQEPGLEPGSVV